MTPAEIFQELEAFAHVVVATTDGEKPEAALVACSYDIDRQQVYFGSEDYTRKMQNIARNTHISLVFVMPKMSIQIDGIAEVLSGDEKTRVKDLHVARHPYAAKYAENPVQQYVAVTPQWARLTDYRGGENIQEVVWS